MISRNIACNEWNRFSRSFRLAYLKKRYPLVSGRFNDVRIMARAYKLKRSGFSKEYTEILAEHSNPEQNKVRILPKTRFRNISLLQRIHHSNGYRYAHDITGKHIGFSKRLVHNELREKVRDMMEDHLESELLIDNASVRLSHPGLVKKQDKLIDLCYFVTELSKDITNNRLGGVRL